MRHLIAKSLVFFLAALFISAVPAIPQSIVINEFMSSNGNTIADEDGDYSDWIELYNAGAEPVNLEGWGISDSLSNPFRWVFPEVTIEPGDYLLVWASGKNRPKSPHAAETLLIEAGAEWLYLDDGSDQGTAWRSTGFNDSSWASGPAPLGYGSLENYVTTTVSYGGDSNFKHITTYFRKHFEVADLDNITSLTLSLWLDDGAVVYLNGVELVRELMPSGTITYVTMSSSYVSDWPNWNHYAVPVDAIQQGTNVLAAEVHQVSRTSSDLAFDLRLLANASVSELHTNFAISAEGEPLTLTRPDETLADEVSPIAVPRDVSYGRTVDGAGTWGFFEEPTPGASNNSSTWYSEILSELEVSHQGGFYTSPFNLTISHSDPNVTIYYTLDGSEPDPENLAGTTYQYKNWYPMNPGQSPTSTFLTRQMQTYIYSTPLSITDRSSQAYQLAGINVEFTNSVRTPYSNTFKGTVVRARAFKTDAIPSRCATSTYFVNPDIMTLYALPVISIVTNEDNFFDYEKGIYVAGKIGDDWRIANPSATWDGGKPGNYKERGIEWEREAHFEMFETDGTLMLSQNIGTRIHGGWSRSWYPKSIRMYARSDYDNTNAFEYPIFEGLEKRGHPGEPLTSFRRLILRGSGNDYEYTYFRDALMQELISHLSLDMQAYRPAVHFINGEYWGMTNIRERLDQHYLANHYEMDADDAVILTGSGAWLDTGFETDRDHFLATVSYAQNNDPSQSVHYEWLCQRLDPGNLADYYAVEIYYVNTDWPNNNIDFWRKRTEAYEPDAPYGHDGRWRWMVYDLDFGMSLYGDNYTTDSLNRVMTGSFGQTNTLFNRMRLNTEFRNLFVNAMADLMNTSFKPAYVNSLIDTYNARLGSSRSEHNNRWRTNLVSSYEQTKLQTFANQRPSNVRTHLRNRLGVGVDRQLTLNVSDVEHGFIRVNRTDITAETPGVDPVSPYPWSGLYFQGVPVTVTAAAQPGYVFSHWDGPAGIDPQAQTLTLSLTDAVSLTANFEEAPEPTLMHYWHFNNLPGGTLTTVAADYSIASNAQITYPGSGAGYMDSVSEGSLLNARMLEPEGYALRVRNPSDTRELLLELPTSGYENIILSYAAMRTTNGAQQQAVYYRLSDTDPWVLWDDTLVITESFQLFTFDFSAISGVNDNPEFAVRILFGGSNASGTSGNNRFDNITLEGFPLPGTNQPPQLDEPIPFTQAILNNPIMLNLSEHFSDPDNDILTFTADANKPFVIDASVSGSILTLTPLYQGDSLITITADDGHNPAIETSFRVLVYPQAKTLRLGIFDFNEWSPEYPEHTFPNHMLFLQSDVTDPGLTQALEYAYFIPHDDYHADDQSIIGYPYKTTGRTRLNGLDEDGISFINTGRGRDLGGALIALDTTGLDGVRVSWLAGTILQNYRRYAIRLQYRIGIDAPFADVLHNDEPIEYIVQTDNHTQNFGPFELPSEAADKPYVQILWRYYHIDVTSGARAQLRLDDISVSGVLDIFEDLGLFIPWWLNNQCGLYNHCNRADLDRSGQVDFNDFAILAAQWIESQPL